MIKIILVDDHNIFRESLKRLLESEKIGKVVAEAKNGKEFIEIISNITPDIVLMDIAMPIMDGIEATRKAIEIKPALQVLALSMYGDEKYYQKMIESGVKGFIIKNADIKELEQAIKRVSFDKKQLEKTVRVMHAKRTV